MNEVYLQRLKEDLRLKNYAKNTCEDYYRFVVRFLNFTGKDAMSVTYADIRKFVFHMMDNESKKASTINAYTAAIRFFFEYTLGYVWDPKKLPKMKRDRYLPVVLTREQVGMLIDSMDNYKHKAITAIRYSATATWRSLRNTGTGTAAQGDGSFRAQSGTSRSRPALSNCLSKRMPGH